MKRFGYSLIIIGLLAAIMSVWIARHLLIRDIRAQIAAIALLRAPQSSTASNTQALRDAAMAARDNVYNALSQLRTDKTSAIRHADSLANRLNDMSLEETRNSLAALTGEISQLNEATTDLDDRARDSFSAYETFVNRTLDDIKEKQEKPIVSFGDVLGFIGGLVSLGGLAISWRADGIERQKKQLEIEQLRRRLGQPAKNA